MRKSRSFSAALFFGYKITKIKSFTHHKRLKKNKKGKRKTGTVVNTEQLLHYTIPKNSQKC